MAEVGGYRAPSNPAPVSGPGAMSRRTDGRQPARWMAGGEYGDGKDLYELQTSAPMSEAPRVSPRGSASAAYGSGGGGASVTPLFAPTERPDEPVTAGAPFGAGPGPSASSAQPGRYAQIVEYLPMLEQAAAWPDTPAAFKSLVRFLQGQR